MPGNMNFVNIHVLQHLGTTIPNKPSFFMKNANPGNLKAIEPLITEKLNFVGRLKQSFPTDIHLLYVTAGTSRDRIRPPGTLLLALPQRS